MRSRLFALPGLFASGWALAASLDEGAAAPVQTVSLTYVAIFLVFFVGIIAGSCLYYWHWVKKQEKKDGK